MCPKWVRLLVGVACLLPAGCSGMRVMRPGNPGPVRTLASIGDRPLPVTAGEPGSLELARSDDWSVEPERSVRPAGRISGRVLDERGNPIPDARVRLAIGGTPTGRAVRSTTDASGGFTLNGLRPGSSYTVIAETDDAEGRRLGRSVIRAPESDAVIRLALAGSGLDDEERTLADDRTSTRVSFGGEVEESAPAEPTRSSEPGGVNWEDVPDVPTKTIPEETSATNGWRPVSRRVSAPSIEPVESSLDRPESVEPTSWHVPDPSGRRRLEPLNPVRLDEEPPLRSDDEIVRTSAEEPGALVPAEPSETPGSVVRTRRSVGGRPTWGEVDIESRRDRTSRPEPLPAATDRTDSFPSSRSSSESAARASLTTKPSASSSTGGRWRLANLFNREPGTFQPTCRYDAQRLRLMDFRLPDLEGKPVRLRDFDADYVLLDFWGTWCGPCRASIPHLINLQKTFGPSKLKIIGIAYEDPDTRDPAAKVAEAARTLGINYTLLIGRTEDACPLREAMEIRAFPTLILLDREGRILWRDQGASERTLARLDSLLQTSTPYNAKARLR